MTESRMEPIRISTTRYFQLTECGIISPDDRVELLDGMIVSMTAQSAPHASTVYRVEHVLLRKLPPETVVRTQMTFLAGLESVPEPDIAVVPGKESDYWEEHPSTAQLIVEVAQTSIIQDRLTKAAIYARAGVPCYWIVNVRDRCVEIFRQPDRFKAQYADVVKAMGRERFSIEAFPGVFFEADELAPPASASTGYGN